VARHVDAPAHEAQSLGTQAPALLERSEPRTQRDAPAVADDAVPGHAPSPAVI
jgi:hypothetical protein